MKKQTDDPRSADKVMQDVLESARRTYKESTEAITALARETDAESLFITVASLLSYAPAELIGEVERGDSPAKVELLAFLLYPHIGVSATKPDFNQVNNCLDHLDKASQAGSHVMMFEDFERRRFDPLGHLRQRVRIHARFVRGSAYPEQTAEEIQMIQGKFGAHFQRQSGISPSRALAITWAILEEQERKINVIIPQAFEVGRSYELLWEEAKSTPPRSRTAVQENLVSIAATRKVAAYIGYLRHMTSVLPEAIPVAAEELRRVEPPPSHEEWDALIELVGMTAKRREQYSEPQQIQFSPLFVLADHRVLLNGLTCAVDALWYAYDRVARKDHVFFDGPYQKTKSKWLEDKVYESLTRIFPAASVFRNVSYPDPEKSGAATAELDFLISWPPFLLIVEVKSYQFKEESQLGDMHKLRRDLKSNLENAFTQARRARAYFESNQTGRFCEKNSGRILSLESNRIRKTYLVSVSLHELAGLATNLASLRDLGLFGDGEYPFATCCADLELISQFAKSPDVFLHYLERRLDILHKPPQVAGDEMDMFGAYLECRLQEDVLFPKGGKPLSWVGLDGFSEPFDKWMMYKRDDIHEKPTIGLKVPEIVRAILDCLRRDSQNESARWISFALLGFSDRMLNAIGKSIQEIRTSTLTPGMFRRVTFEENDVVVSIVASMDQTTAALRERTEMRAITEKYRRRAGKSIGLGILLNTQRSPIDCALWIEGLWEYDETLERALEHEPIPVLVEGQTLPGRNEPCFCGSRKKFKKCCLSKISRH